MTITYTDGEHDYLIHNVAFIRKDLLTENEPLLVQPNLNEMLICYVDNDAGIELEYIRIDTYKPITIYKI